MQNLFRMQFDNAHHIHSPRCTSTLSSHLVDHTVWNKCHIHIKQLLFCITENTYTCTCTEWKIHHFTENISNSVSLCLNSSAHWTCTLYSTRIGANYAKGHRDTFEQKPKKIIMKNERTTLSVCQLWMCKFVLQSVQCAHTKFTVQTAKYVNHTLVPLTINSKHIFSWAENCWEYYLQLKKLKSQFISDNRTEYFMHHNSQPTTQCECKHE